MGGDGQEDIEAGCAGQGSPCPPGCSKRMSCWKLVCPRSVVLYQCIASYSLRQGLRYPCSLKVCSTFSEESGFGWSYLRVSGAVPQSSGIGVAERGMEVRTAQFLPVLGQRHEFLVSFSLLYFLTRDLGGLVSQPSRCPESIFSDGVCWACNF